jgi:hypothetical protein
MVVRFSSKWLLHLVGGGLGLAGVIFVVLRLNAYAQQIDLARFNLAAWSIVALLALVYGAGNLLLARAWWHLLAFFEVKTKWRWACKAYGLSQLAKYVPGNIFHLAGRQALGMAAGLPTRPLVKSAVWELGLIAIAGALFSLLTVPLVWPDLSLWLSYLLFVVVTAILFAALYKLLSSSLAVALIWQMAFLVVSGLVFFGTLTLVVTPTTVLPAMTVLCGAFVIAWLVGLVTPGAPAGVGVRELVLLFLLKGVVGEADLLLAVVFGRVVTVVGDLLYFMMATFLKQGESNG